MNWNSIYIKIGLFIAYVVIFSLFIYTKGAVKLKKRLWGPFIVFTYIVIAGHVYFQDRDPWTLLFLTLAGVLICFGIIRCSVSFCTSCGCTVYDRARFTKPTECPKCGAKLDYRPLTDWERRIILRLLKESPFTGRDTLLVQLEHVVAQPIDEDGSLSLKCSSALKASVKVRIPVEGEAPDLDNTVIHYLLHVVNGRMNELEVYKDDSSRVLRQAEPEDLKVMNAG